uniref:TROVE domain-containing protein n=1 Tax=Lotharella oceanica TaxID=641309 RepID=A0A7S2TM20_9EUKA|mmetsp:Transcript_20483/g.38518  ORF Transcript_20483/g.38518 Transcript_20483/m.38518 type:complete len:565 (+) Transcript_20483:60-1754(+)
MATALNEKGAMARRLQSQCLALFTSGLLRDTEAKTVLTKFDGAWKENPDLAMKILLHARDCRGGKGERKAVMVALGWLRKNKPKTYSANLASFIEHGCYRDLVQLAAQADPKNKGGGVVGELELGMLCEQLKADVVALRKPKETKLKNDENKMAKEAKAGVSISLAAKWAPTEGGKYDKKDGPRLAKRLACLMFPDIQTPKKQYRLMLSELRGHLKVVEKLMVARQWKAIEFDKVPSRAHNLYKKAFRKHAGEEYAKFIGDVKTGKKTIKAKAMQPHELVKYFLDRKHLIGKKESLEKLTHKVCPACTLHNRISATLCEVCGGRLPSNADSKSLGAEAETVEAQWRSLVEGLRTDGCLKDAMAVVDVSGSMHGQPMEVSIAMGILVSQLANAPFHGRLVTFAEKPKWHRVPVETKSLAQMTKSVANMEWGANTNIERVFNLLLTTAVQHKLPQEALPKTLFIFTDMQFDAAAGTSENETVIELVKKRFAKAGYTLPRIILWNLRTANTDGYPVSENESGVAMVSGFSADLLRNFMRGKIMTPLEQMLKTVGGYASKVVVAEDER